MEHKTKIKLNIHHFKEYLCHPICCFVLGEKYPISGSYC